MRLYVQFKLSSPLTLPLNYQQILQGFIYNQIDDETFSRFLHEEGYTDGRRIFKMFTFSRLQGKGKINPKNKTITFEDKVSWEVSSCLPKFIQSLGQSMLMKDFLYISNHPVSVEELQYKTTTVNDKECVIRMVSPITVHSTFEGRASKTTQYYKPWDHAFVHLINENINNKYRAYYGEQLSSRVAIKPIKVNKKDKIVTRFKGFIIEAWNGTYLLQGEPNILTFACTVGIGSKNSQGFGLPEVLN
ncbi:CRISPR-associated endoribonuclease Cas6 [Geomicrobium halophilum]|uniref:CRISPR-associated endoribonuclease n=1 Tax=Geomicrobium halophilum TaxID=549000 RepID=A0A841PWS3_9BACL|nr:CRISPR-associated endoribonuclease Cas6 [Geomicrobium halophilum]MBB6450971.1 CRISPR-associated endoribonuclease Cas6 [Geomicrobium halophilum]